MTPHISDKVSAEKFKIKLYYWPPDVDETNPIVSATAEVSPSGLTLEGDVEIVGQELRQMISGGAAGVTYLVQFKVTTYDESYYCNPDFDAIQVRVS